MDTSINCLLIKRMNVYAPQQAIFTNDIILLPTTTSIPCSSKLWNTPNDKAIWGSDSFSNASHGNLFVPIGGPFHQGSAITQYKKAWFWKVYFILAYMYVTVVVVVCVSWNYIVSNQSRFCKTFACLCYGIYMECNLNWNYQILIR